MMQQRETAMQRLPMTGRDPYRTAIKKPYQPPYMLQNALSFIAMLIGFILFLIAFGGPAWYVVPNWRSILPKTFGLWQFCVRGQCVVEMTNDYMVKKYLAEYPLVIPAFEFYLMPVKVLMCVALVSSIIMVAFNLAFIAGFPTFFLEWITQLLGGILTAVSVGIFGGYFKDDFNKAPFGWSYWLAVVATMIYIVNGAIMAFISFLVFRQRGNSFFRRK